MEKYNHIEYNPPETLKNLLIVVPEPVIKKILLKTNH